ncbi:MAG: cupin domain-containing protein [Alphaproteobacteria bacterium]
MAIVEINTDLTKRAVHETEAMPWSRSPMDGVTRRMLERQGEDGRQRATSIVRYAPGSRFSAHTHRAGEEFLVLEGTFSDENGDYGHGCYVRNPPGSFHAPFSTAGTTIFVKLQQFAGDDTAQLALDTNAAAWRKGDADGIEFLVLHQHGDELVHLFRLAPGAALTPHEHPGGEEVFVLGGAIEDEEGRYPKGCWLRNPPGSRHAPRTPRGALLDVKSGHLGGS